MYLHMDIFYIFYGYRSTRRAGFRGVEVQSLFFLIVAIIIHLHTSHALKVRAFIVIILNLLKNSILFKTMVVKI